jgi:hypothetical protein
MIFSPVMAAEALKPMNGFKLAEAHEATAAREGGQNRKLARTEKATSPVLLGVVRTYASYIRAPRSTLAKENLPGALKSVELLDD